MIKIINDILQAIKIIKLPKERRKIIFYSEGKDYWPIFEGIIKILIKETDLYISYITSDKNDIGLGKKINRFSIFFTDEKYVRNWLFANLEADIVVMTMPDLNQYQLKRSKHNTHYIYLQHALMSLHMAYREGAFNFYDSIFCSGPHHISEIRAIEKKFKLSPKKLYQHGYSRLDSLIKEVGYPKAKNTPKQILFAPTWGIKAAIESGVAEKLIDKLLIYGYRVIFRPHPETIKSSFSIIDKILKKHTDNAMLKYDASISSLNSYYHSDLMISDWSGAAIEYAFALKKPVIFLDLPKKINNPNYKDINIEPFEVSIRKKIGYVVKLSELSSSLINSISSIKVDIKEQVFNIGKSDYYGAKHIIKILKNIENINHDNKS